MRKVSCHSKTLPHRSQQGYDLWGYFLRNTRNSKCFNNHYFIHYFSWSSFRSSHSEVLSIKGVLTISQNLQQKNCACGLQLYLKKDSVTGVWMLWNFWDTFFNRTPPAVASFLLSKSFLHFILKWQDCKNLTKLVPSQTSF